MGGKSKTQRRAEAKKKKAEEAEAEAEDDDDTRSDEASKESSAGYAPQVVPIAPSAEVATAPQKVDADSSESTSAAQDIDELVGYLEDPPEEDERYLLQRHFFPSKIGGRPAWLIPDRMPTDQDMTCEKCGLPLRFLLQVYASQGDYRPQCFHRTLHFFVCTGCQPSQIKVFRAQLPRENSFYSSEAPDYDDDNEKDKKLDKILKKHPLCTGSGRPAYYFDERELRVTRTAKDEDEDSGDDSEAEDDEETKHIINSINNEDKEVLQHHLDDSENKDEQFKKFLAFAKEHNGHALRYELGGEPLWLAVPGQLNSYPPRCENCGAKRTFELQIQPQLISLLKNDRLDWGVVCCYTCSESCNPPGTGSAYLQEWIYMQHEPEDWRAVRRGDAEEMLAEDRKAEEEAKFMAADENRIEEIETIIHK